MGLTPGAAENYKGSRALLSTRNRADFRGGAKITMLAAATKPEPFSTATRPAWRDVELLLVVLLMLGVYFIRLTDLTIRGEESRWARVAQEMIETGDYVVPRQQGQPFPDRPPLNSWLMVAVAQVTGGVNLDAVRLPSALATLVTVVLIYLYGRNFLSPLGALTASVAYGTMGQVLQLGRVGESDALLTLTLTAAFFAWHCAYLRRRDPRLAWMAGYALAALAALAKGPQGPVYFFCATSVTLFLARDWRFLFSRWHALGLATFVAIVGSWYVPFLMRLGGPAALEVWMEGGNLASRFQSNGIGRVLKHWVEFPLELFGAMLPWSFLLPPLATPWFRQRIGAARPYLVFLLTACAVALPTCWLPFESRPRYFMALYPCVALLVGLVVERSAAAVQQGWWARSWDNFLVAGLPMVLLAPLSLGLFRFAGGATLREIGHAVTPMFGMLYGAAAVAAVTAMLWSRLERERWHVEVGVLALAGFLGLSYATIVLNVQQRTSNDPSQQIAELRELVTAEGRFVSFGPVHHLFAYYFGETIDYRPLDKQMTPVDCDAEYFCFAEDPGFPTAQVPFPWERVAEISCERARSAQPRAKVIVGRRIVLSAAAPADESPATATPASFDAPADPSQAR